MGVGRNPEGLGGSLKREPGSHVPVSEARAMSRILDEYKDHVGSFEMVRVGDAGWALQRQGRPIRAYPRIVVTSDVDDTLIATNQLKRLRIKRFGDFIKQPGGGMTEDVLAEMMTSSYAHAQDVLGGGRYDMGNHALAFAYALGHPGVDALPDTTEELQRDTDPDVVAAYQKIFQETLSNIPQYPKMVAALKVLGGRKAQEQMAINLFTYGTPPEQLVKSLDLLKNNRELLEVVDQIWITKVPKDEFMKTAIDTGSLQDLSRSYTDDKDRGDGHIFGNHRHVIVGLDDSLQSVNAQARVTSYLPGRTGAELTLVRVRQEGAKDSNQNWQERGEHEELDLRANPMTAEEIAEYVLEIARRRLAGGFDSIPGPRDRRGVIPVDHAA